jgi:predicted nuclease of predicted toxin-antitoxin system
LEIAVAWVKCPAWDQVPDETAGAMRSSRRAKLYADENVDEILIADLRSEKVNVLSARELGHHGKPDSFHASMAHKYSRCLLTKDRDFLDDRAFPFNQLSGVIVLKDRLENEGGYSELLDTLLIDLIPYGNFLRDMKVEASDTDITWRYVDWRGFIDKKHYRLIDGLWYEEK